MHRIFRHLFSKAYPELDWIQIEITSYCNSSCIYCPHSAYKDNWQNEYFSLDTFYNLVPSFEKTRHIHLQGWGEPFAHPDLIKMITLAKKAGCSVGTTTNGSLLSPEYVEKLVNEDLDVIAFSLAGVDEGNDSIRRGTSIKKVLQAVEEIHRAKENHHSENPKIHIAYMLLRSGFNDLEKLPAFLGNIGADQVVISSLSLVVQPELEDESFLALDNEEYSELRLRLLELRENSADLGVDVFFHVVSPMIENDSCSENIGNALVIGSDGSVSPCVMANIPAKGTNYYYINGTKRRLKRINFGNILDNSLNDIWNQEEYGRFRKSFSEDRKEDSCRQCLKLRIDNLLDKHT